jgi:two-component sensor histidine kinase
LQIISSLLSLQSNEIKDSASKEKFIDAVNRVQSISALHKVIYNSDNLLKINLETYLHEIAENIIRSYGLKKEINYTISSELTSIQNDSIVPISLILNELMSNSLKHGFANQQVCEITVVIVALGENKYQLCYSDNGTWKTAEPTNSSFGIELIQSLTEQLDGKIVQTPSAKESLYVIEFFVETF